MKVAYGDDVVGSGLKLFRLAGNEPGDTDFWGTLIWLIVSLTETGRNRTHRHPGGVPNRCSPIGSVPAASPLSNTRTGSVP